MLPCYLHDDCKVLICTMSRRYTKWIALNYLNSLHEYINDVVFTGVVYWTSILDYSSIIWDTRLHTVDLLVVDQAVQLTFFVAPPCVLGEYNEYKSPCIRVHWTGGCVEIYWYIVQLYCVLMNLIRLICR